MQDFMGVLVACKNEEDPIKNEGASLFPARMKKIHWKMKALKWSQRFSHYKSMGIFPNAKGQLTPIKNEGARVVTTLFIDFSDAQGQLTPKSVMESCQNSNPSKILWLSLLPARIKKNQSKMKESEWS